MPVPSEPFAATGGTGEVKLYNVFRFGNEQVLQLLTSGIGTSRTSADVHLKSAKWAKADIALPSKHSRLVSPWRAPLSSLDPNHHAREWTS